ncbi:MAG: S41 family peptidase [Planctomycetota bacterium]
MSRLRILLGVLGLAGLIPEVAAAQESRLLRYPDIHQDKIVFVYGGDLWTVPSQGGSASKLTSFPGPEVFPKFSPDGKSIAFSSSYDGNPDVYTIPVEGGEPTRLTYHPDSDTLIDWHPEGKSIVFMSGRESYSYRFAKLFSIAKEGGLPEALPMPRSGIACYSPDGRRLAYTRLYLENRTWKRYLGGMAQDILIFDLATNMAERITDYEGADNFPMWAEEAKLYFVSDRSHAANIFCYDFTTKEIRQVTQHADFDVKWPSLGPEAIVYENGGWLYVLDLKTEQTRKLSIDVRDDRVQTRPYIANVSRFIQNAGISPSGQRAVFEARGDIFTVPKKEGDARNITQSPESREIDPAWSPDGKWIVYLSDKTGEYELYLRSHDGTGEETRLTTDGSCYRFQPLWSPDSKKLLFSDKQFILYYLDIDSKKPVLIDKSEYGDISDYAWSHDSRWVTYSKVADPNGNSSIFIYSLETGKVARVTSSAFADSDPVFDGSGKYLYFISSRSFIPSFSDFEPTYNFQNTRRIYLVTLKEDLPSPFAPRSDEEKGPTAVYEDEKEELFEEGDQKSARVEIDFDGIEQRTVAFPFPPGLYFGLQARKEKLYYVSMGSQGLMAMMGGRGTPAGISFNLYDIARRENFTVISGINGYDLSVDGQKILYIAGNTYGIVELEKKKKDWKTRQVGEGVIDASRLETKIDPRLEWKQIFAEAWRIERDFFYDPNMHGVDWKKMRERYAEFLPHVATRDDLNYVLGELIAELCCGHTYVMGGDMRTGGERVPIGVLGADLEVDPLSQFYRFKKIYRGENWGSARSPLAMPGVNVEEGEFLVAIDEQPLKSPANPWSSLVNKVGKKVTLKVNGKPTMDGAREVVIEPLASDTNLRYIDWVEGNRRKVEKATGGRVGYIHVPDTSIEGLNEFSKGFFPQIDKEGLIVDVRFNSGGMIPDQMMEHLRRKVVSLWAVRDAKDFKTPEVALNGHMACIINEYAGSGGDAFPHFFQTYKLGPLVGLRTWGGLVGITGRVRLIDGGMVTAPQFAIMSPEGEWIVENRGVEPDYPVDDRPDLVIRGFDPQLEKAISLVMDEVVNHPKTLPKRPPFPKRD